MKIQRLTILTLIIGSILSISITSITSARRADPLMTLCGDAAGAGDRIARTGAANIEYVPSRTAVVPDGDGLLDARVAVLKVTQSNLQTSQMQHAHCVGGTSTSSQQFVTGPGTPPLGTGSLRFTTGSDGDSFETVRYPGLDTVRIDSLTALSYSTYVTNFTDSQAPYILLNIDFNGDTTIDDQLFFEPLYQTAAFFPSNPQAQIVEGQWQTWDALSGGWWSLNNTCGAGIAANVKSLAQYLSCQPNARIINATGGLGGFRIATGCGGSAWANFDGNIDNVSIVVNGTETSFDFDPDLCTTITCPADQTVNIGPGATDCCATVNYPDPTADASCGTIACSPPSGSCYPVGVTTVSCGTIQDGPNCTFTVTVTDNTPPALTCPMNQTLSADANCQAVATYNATATDICTESPLVICTPQSGSSFPKGTTTVTCTATDGGGNTAMCSFTVTVNDITPPAITCPANITKPTDPNQCCAVAAFSPTVNDNCPGATFTCSPPSGNCFPVGTTTVTCTAKDAVNLMASCTFTVTVQDTQPPSITCPGNITSTTGACPPSSSGTVNFTVTQSDNCSGVTTVCRNQNNQVVTPGQSFPVGTTTVTCTATDASGNAASCSFTVTVFNGCLQDDSDPARVVIFNAQTGQYRFCCGGTVFTGTGTVTVRGCIVTIQHNAPDRRVQITLDGSVRRGSASLQSPPGTTRCTITDKDTTNNSCVCQ